MNSNIALSLKTIAQVQKNFKSINPITGNRDTINILFCDVQDKYIKKIANSEELVQKTKIMAEISKQLKFNQIITEQKKEVFGITLPEIQKNLNDNALLFEKTRFAMFSEDEIDKLPENQVTILLGIETHVCVYQTALNFIRKNRPIIILADAVSSSNLGERKMALKNLRDMGCYITTCQALIFLMLQDAGDNQIFKPLVKSLKELSLCSYNLLLDEKERELKGKF